MKKHVIVRGQIVDVVQSGKDTIAAPMEATRGSLVISFEPDGELFVARIAGETWEGRRREPVSAIAALVESIWTDGYADEYADLPSLMRHIQEEI